MGLDWLFLWWNAIYAVPLGIVLILLLVTGMISLAGGGFGHDHSGGVNGSHGADAGHLHGSHEAGAGDAHVSHGADAGAGQGSHGATAPHPDFNGGVHAGRDGHPDHEWEGIQPLLSLLGAGRAPLLLILQVLVICWGATGLLLHDWANAAGPLALLWSVPVSGLAALCVARGMAEIFGRVFPQDESSALQRDQLVGRIGTVVYTVTESSGTVNVRDEYGTLHRLRAHTPEGALATGREVIVVGYDPGANVYVVDDSTTFVGRT